MAQKDNKELLDEIHSYLDGRKSPELSLVHIIASLSSLLVNLSDQTEKSTKKIICLTYVLVIFTVALLFVGIMQIRIMEKQNSQFNIQCNKAKENNAKPQADNVFSKTIHPLPPKPVIPEEKTISKTKTDETKNEK